MMTLEHFDWIVKKVKTDGKFSFSASYTKAEMQQAYSTMTTCGMQVVLDENKNSIYLYTVE